ncbi:alpha/beta hydrolase [Microbulbifer taiwanensis]|uniref:Alpha/beta hydrolase n=1 Tax=Microbulbifer taiwanensis TaxID=986746 RepID=A0ABW1YNM7_9GAMM|nr:alpha/beta hydrolase [Microbulbifer taiwanensis]
MGPTNTFALLLGLLVFTEAVAATELRHTAPDTVSDGWQQVFASAPDPTRGPEMPAADDLEGWGKIQSQVESTLVAAGDRAVDRYRVAVERRTLGGVPVADIRPRGWKDDGRLLVYTHGGAYTFYSSRSAMPSSALVAASTGLRVISIDYTLAPHARWRQVTDQVLAVFRALNAEDHPMERVAIYGDSAGGALAAGAVLKMRDRGLDMPAAVVLWSPWADISETGDTYATLKDVEPRYTYARLLGPAAAAYADPAEQKHPYVSPVYGDFSRGFPPTLIQGGTREIFLSNFVRLYQALDGAGQEVQLDIYEGMPHVFQPTLPDSPESRRALGKMQAFLDRHLDTG